MSDAAIVSATDAGLASTDGGSLSDAGLDERAAFWATDGSVPCGVECEVEAGGDPNCAGDFVIGNDQQWQAFQLRGCSYLSGNLELSPTDMTSLTATGLLRVSGMLRIRNSALTSISFPDLAMLGWNLDFFGDDRLTTARFPQLTTSGSLNLTSAGALTTLELPLLEEVRGHVSVGNNVLTTISFPSLTRARGAYMSIGGSALQTISAPVLHTVVGNLAIGGPSLTTLNMPSLVRAGALFIGNSALSSLELRSLATVMDGQVRVSSNPQLRQCLVDALRDQLTPPPMSFESSGNDGMPNICP